MNWFRLKLLLCGLIALAGASLASAQDWPVPAATPNTPVPCTGCVGGKAGLLTPGYPPVLNFVGRYADAEYVTDYQNMFRTARPRGAFFIPGRNRLYLLLGSALAAYDIDRFFTRLAAHEPLTVANGVPTNPSNAAWRYDGSELFLWWDRFFYAEHGSPWICPVEDGQDRLWRNGMDFEDRIDPATGKVVQYCYLAYTAYSWGIVHDDAGTTDGSLLSTVQQVYPTDIIPSSIVSVPTSDGHYYALISEDNGSKIEAWNVDNPANPVKQADQNGRSLEGWAKDATKTHFAVVEWGGHGKVYNADALARGSAPIIDLAPVNGIFAAVDSDGTNFFFYGAQNFQGVITIMKPNGGGGYTRTDVPILNDAGAPVSYQTYQGIRASPGLVAVFGYEGQPMNSWNIRLYKLSNGNLTQISLDNVANNVHGPFFAQYYGSASPGSGYTHPNYNNFYDVVPYKYNGKTYIVLAGYGLGDVWEVKSGDTLNASVKALAETPNPNSKGTGAGPYYGDRQTFTSALLSGAPVTVNWTFDDSTSGTTLPGTTDIKHQFGGTTNIANLPAAHHATATNAADNSMATTLTVSLAKPAVRFGLLNTAYLFTQPNASSATPIVSSDSFFDGSDGAVEGHFAEWALDTTSTKKLPSDTFGVGVCGVHSLNFIGHYGAYSGSGASLASLGPDLPVAISDSLGRPGPFVYTSRPFAVDVQLPPPIVVGAPPSNAVFTAVVRATTSTTDLPAGLSTPVTYLWEVVGANGSAVPGLSQGGPKTLGTIPVYSLDRSVFNTLGSKVRLTLTAAPSALSGACAPFVASALMTDALNAPDPTIAKSGCDNAGSPCSFSVTSSGSQSGWAYAWSITNLSATSTTSTFAPTITTGGTYTITLVVTNAIGSATRTIVINPLQPLCSSAPTSDNTSFGVSGCANPNQCQAGESATFRIFPYLWTLDPACDTATWNFGDSSTGSGFVVNHTYAANGTYTVQLVLKGGLSTATLTNSVTIGPVIIQPQPPQPPNPQPGNCPAQNADSAYIGYLGSLSNCYPGGGSCNAGEPVSFGAYSTAYNFDCSTESYVWNFGDSSSGSDRFPQHTYLSAGTYHVTLSITNVGGTGSYSLTVQVGSTQTPPPPPPPPTPPNPQPQACGNLSTQTIAMTWIGSGCTDQGGDCNSTSPVAFTAVGIGYNFSCGTHQFDWDYGDGTAHGTSISASHIYSNAGTYTAKLTVTYGNNGTFLTKQVHVTTQSGILPGPCPLMISDSNVYIVYYGTQSSCGTQGSSCGVGDLVNFKAFAYNYDYGCSTHTFHWDFGDGNTSTDQNPIHPFAHDGTYQVKVTITNAQQTIDLLKTVIVGTGESNAPPPRGGRAVRH